MLKISKRMNFIDEDTLEMDSVIFTPPKDDTALLTADSSTPASYYQPPLVVDEDSGLGMTPSLNAELKLSLSDGEICSPCELGARRSLFTNSFKRCSEGDADGSITKRYRPESGGYRQRKRRHLKKSLSFEEESKPFDVPNEVEIKEVVDRLTDGLNLTGNGSQMMSLPTIKGKHSDLNSIRPETMVDLLEGRYDDVINSYHVIDCRYPYEYEGGHIMGAENIYENEKLLEFIQRRVSSASSASPTNQKRDIIIFYCEFSSERGPRTCRNLRSLDREMNADRYPFLYFPEIYLLHDGYKLFYEFGRELCRPMSYKPMLHSNHASDLRHFRAKSKSWTAGEKRRRSGQRLCF